MTTPMVWSADANGMVVEDSRTWREYTGQSVEEWMGEGWLDAVHPEDRAETETKWQNAVATATDYHVVYRVRRRDGRWRRCEARGVPIALGNGVQEWIGTTTDVEDFYLATERARALQELAADLAVAQTAREVASAAYRSSAGALGAVGGGVAVVAEGGGSLEFLATELPEEVQPRWRTRPIDPTADPASTAVITGHPVFVDSAVDLLAGWPPLSTHYAGGEGAWAALPLIVAGRAVGVLALSFDASRTFSDEERVFFQALARQTAQALDRAQLYEREHSIAEALQRRLLPERLPLIPGITLSARYRASSVGTDVGGDWYDVIELRDDRLGLVIGDVAGHSITAAGVMGQVRNALRAFASANNGPATVVGRLNHLLRMTAVEELVTCCYMELDRRSGLASVVSAGHPPPVVVDRGGSAGLLALESQLLLGAANHVDYGETTVLLDEGTTVLLFTDGLVESRTLGLTEGLELLVSRASESRGRNLDEMIERIIGFSHVAEDDQALLGVRFDKAAGEAGRRARRSFRCELASARVARRFAADVFAAWGWGDTDGVGTVVDELMANAVRHSASDVELVVEWHGDTARIEVRDDSWTRPVLRVPDEDDPSGRGMMIVDALSASWGVVDRGDGKTVWSELERT